MNLIRYFPIFLENNAAEYQSIIRTVVHQPHSAEEIAQSPQY